MSSRKYIFLPLCLSLFCNDVALDYDFFKNAQLPGVRRQEVSLDHVTDEALADGVPSSYQRRTVEWWPKKGVDTVDIPEGAPLRTWTINQESVTTNSPHKKRWWPLALRNTKTFKAHLIGFRGLGMRGDPFKRPDRKSKFDSITPAVVLRLEDGRKRCFTRGSFSDKDERYICELFEREIKKLRDSTFEDGITWTINPRHAMDFPPGGELYKAGTTILESKHFAALMGTEDPEDNIGSRWLIMDNKEQAAANRKSIMLGWENWWAYLEYAGHLMPYWEKPQAKYKYAIQIGGTKRDGSTTLGRGNGGSYGAMTSGDGNWWGMYHEWTHGQLNGGMISLGGGETMCDAAQIMGDPSHVNKMMFQVVKPWKNLFWGAYPGGYAWATMGDDPNWGYCAVGVIPPLMADGEHTPMHAIARLGKKRGIFKNGIRGMGDMMGQIGARMAEFDTELQSGLRAKFTMPTRSALQTIDLEKRLYRSPLIDSPEPFGVNLIKLMPDIDATEITVDFKGHFDAKTYSDWRACIVAVDQEGRCRYSPLFNKGTMTIAIKPGDRRYWLTVTATPYALSSSQPDGKYTAWTIYQGGFAYVYPYDVRFSGCLPASPHTTLEENDVLGHSGSIWGMRRGEGGNAAIIPATVGKPGYKRMKDALKNSKVKEEILHLANAEGAPHINGGGWVSKDATVAPSAYIAKDAMVLDQAKVLGSAVINDYVIVMGSKAVVKDHARVYGKVIIDGSRYSREYSENARVYRRDEDKEDISSQESQIRRIQWESENSRFTDSDITLQANYGCDVPETVILEDYYRDHSTSVFFYGAHRSDLISFSGVLRGSPGFEKMTNGGALSFNGVDQYGELPGEVADLEESTIAIRFKSNSSKSQTLYSFGSSTEDNFKLTLSNNKLTFSSIKGGKTLYLKSTKTLRKREYHSCRIEMDGVELRLFLNDVLEVRTASTYRPSQAFLPGKVRSGFLARDFEGKKLFVGAIDYLRVFTKSTDRVATDEIPLVSPRKISVEFEERFKRRFPNYDAQVNAAEAATKSHPLTRYYQKYNSIITSRILALRSIKTPRILKIEKEYELTKQELARLNEESTSQRKSDANFAKKQQEMSALINPLKQQIQALWKNKPEYVAADTEFRELRSLIQQHSQAYARLNGKRDPKFQSLKKVKDEFEAKLSKATPSARIKIHKQARPAIGAFNSHVEAQLRKDPEINKIYLRQNQAKKRYVKIQNQISRSAEVEHLKSQISMLTVHFKPEPVLEAKIQKCKTAIIKLENELIIEKDKVAMNHNPAELRALNSTRYFREAYERTIVKALVKAVPKPSEDIEQLKAAYRFQKADWHTKVDWDGRAAYEFNPASVQQPVMQMFLKKMKPWIYE